MDARPPTALDPAVLALLRCPRSGRPLLAQNREGRGVLTTDDGSAVYEIRDGIPILLPEPTSPTEARAQARAPNDT